LRSPAVATTYDIGEDDGTLFIVMELVEGETLSDRLQRGPLSVRQTLGMTLQIADALDEAHGLGIIHRDVKAANLVIDDQGRVKVLDFGLAKFTGSEADRGTAETMAQTSLGVIVGTVSYMSKDPDARYQSARELLVDLRAVKEEFSQRPAPDASATSGLGVAMSAPLPVPPANSVAVIPFTNITREPTDDWIGSGIAETVSAGLKSIKELVLIGRERVFDALRVLGSGGGSDLEERVAIEVGRQLRATWLVTADISGWGISSGSQRGSLRSSQER
jgi:TolB-like protein